MNRTSLSRVKAACCRLESNVGVGTGYLVGPRQIATCAHVVKGLNLEAVVKARFGESTSPVLAAKLRAVDPRSDCAWLELDQERPHDTVLEFGAVPADDAWSAYGFPAFSAPLGVALTGVVMDVDAEIPGNLRGLALFSQMLGSHPPVSVGGFSGSPVLVGGQVVGHISSVLGAANAMKQPHLGYAYAVPVSSVAALLGRQAVATAPTAPAPPATLEDAIVAQSGVYHALQFAASGAEVHALLEKAGPPGRRSATLRVVAAQVLLGLMLPEQALALLDGTAGTRALELRALALSLMGQHAEAQALTRSLGFSAESRGIEGGISKRRWLATRNPAFLRIAFQTYFEAWNTLRDHYPGINAAACALYLGKRKQCVAIAQEVMAELGKLGELNAWEQASLAEAYLLTEELEAARAQYVVATDALQGRARDVSVMSTQARRNLKHLGLPPDALGDALPSPPGVAAFTGHRIGQHLPNESIPSMRERLRDVLDEQQVRFGFCSAASGSDICFIELLLERGAEVQVFLPFPVASFRKTSVGPEASWLARFDQVIATLGPNRVFVLSDQEPADDNAQPYVACNESIMKAARDKAQALGTSPFLLAVVAADAEIEKPTPGGAADTVQAWLSRGEKDVVKVDPCALFPTISPNGTPGGAGL